MGLDMYLHKTKKVNGYDLKTMDVSEVKNDTILYNKLSPYITKEEGYETFTEEIGYWRKRWYLHNWFCNNLEDNVENCCDSNVTKENIQKLYDDCLKISNNHRLAEKLIPNRDSNYDEYYFDTISYTLEIADEILKEFNFDEYELSYHPWW